MGEGSYLLRLVALFDEIFRIWIKFMSVQLSNINNVFLRRSCLKIDFLGKSTSMIVAVTFYNILITVNNIGM